MAGNKSLSKAMAAKQDEFYTRIEDIEAELRHYRSHFRDKVVLCNCDDPYESNFFKYFAMNFQRLGLKKLIATAYTGSPIAGAQLPLFEAAGMRDADPEHGFKVEITEVTDLNGDGAIDMLDVEQLLRSDANTMTPLSGDGDFRSEECIALLDEADIVISNPPFSVWRSYVAQLIEHDKKFLIIGSQNAITYKEIFPLLRDGKMWLGYNNGDMSFRVPADYEPRATRFWVDDDGQKWRSLGNISWFTNLDIKKRHEDLVLYKRFSADAYPTYDNYDAVNVGQKSEIPYDYAGTMGVPITFLEDHNPDQFDIIGVTQSWDDNRTKKYPRQIQHSADGKTQQVTKLNDGAAIIIDKPLPTKTYYEVDGILYRKTYARLLVRNRRPETAGN